MKEEFVEEYLHSSGMEQAQAHALSRILAEMATKDDLERLRSDLRAEMQTLRAELTLRFYAAVALLAALMTLLDVFVD